MTSSLRHNKKLWNLFLQILKVQTIIYRMMGWSKLYLEWFLSYNRLKRCHFAVFRWSRVESRVGYRNIHQRIYTALAASSSGSCVLLGTFIWCCVLLLDDVMSWCMFEWRSGALARAQIYYVIFMKNSDSRKPSSKHPPDLKFFCRPFSGQKHELQSFSSLTQS